MLSISRHRPHLQMLTITLIAITLATLLSSCATIKKWSCSGKNWYEIGYQTAMNGQRLDADENFRSCKDVEGGMDYAAADKGFKVGMGQYCTKQTAFEYGRDGKTMNFSFCDHPKSLEASYQKGIIAYCQPANALAVGRSGAASRDVCPVEMKSAFVAKYREGRKEYLQVTIRSQGRQIEDIDHEVHGLEGQRSALSYKIQLLPQGSERTRARVYDPQSKTYMEKEIVKEDSEAARRRQNLASEMDNIAQQISRLRDRQHSLRQTRRQMEDELRTY